MLGFCRGWQALDRFLTGGNGLAIVVRICRWPGVGLGFPVALKKSGNAHYHSMLPLGLLVHAACCCSCLVEAVWRVCAGACFVTLGSCCCGTPYRFKGHGVSRWPLAESPCHPLSCSGWQPGGARLLPVVKMGAHGGWALPSDSARYGHSRAGDKGGGRDG